MRWLHRRSAASWERAFNLQVNGYSQLLRQLRVAEKNKNMDLTDRAMAVLRLRRETIEGSDVSPERKEQLLAAADRQWAVFMQRDLPDVWPPQDTSEPPF